MASTAFPTMTMPAARDGLNYLSDATIAKGFEKSLKSLVETVKPEALELEFPWSKEGQAVFPGEYADHLITYLTNKPYALKELVGKEKITFTDLSPADKAWVKNKIVELYKKLRSSSDYTSFSTRIVPVIQYNWMDFRTVDCVFAAIVHELSGGGFEPRLNQAKLKGGDVAAKVTTAEENEAARETWLATQLGLPRTVMEDSRLVYILEEDLGFPNIAAISRYSDLTSNNIYKNKSFIVSYEVRKDFWHTVHVSLKAAKPKITDRQGSATTNDPSITSTAPCDVWQINREGEKFQALLAAFNQAF